MLQLSQAQLEQITRHLESCLPNEGCGLLGGTEGRVDRVVPVDNAAASPLRYRMDPAQQVRAQFAFEEAGLELIGIFHSHPLGPDGPSQADLREAAYPEAVHLICTRQAGKWRCRAYRYTKGGALELELALTD